MARREGGAEEAPALTPLVTGDNMARTDSKDRPSRGGTRHGYRTPIPRQGQESAETGVHEQQSAEAPAMVGGGEGV
jgi:hypothetical protein